MTDIEMKVKRSVLSLFVVATIVTLGVPWYGCHAPKQTTLTISVAASLQDAIAEVESTYQRENAEVIFRNNFGASGTLAREIEDGAPVDAFISAGAKPVDQLEDKGLLQPGSRSDLLRNSLVLIAPKGSNLQSFGQLAEKQVRVIALGDPGSVPAGHYGKQTLESLDLYEVLKSKIVLAKDVRQVLSYVETGNAEAGLVYATDAQISSQVRVVTVAPEGSHSPIVYPIAAIKGSHNDVAVRAFLAFLKSPEAQVIFERHGFKIA